MKLAEALINRRDLQNRLAELRERMTLNARVQEGETPAEEPRALIREMNELSAQLETLVTRINLTNAAALSEGHTLTELLAHREGLQLRFTMLREMLNTASELVMRGGRMEVKIRSSIPVPELRKETDEIAQELRRCDTEIQSLNWTTELL